MDREGRTQSIDTVTACEILVLVTGIMMAITLVPHTGRSPTKLLVAPTDASAAKADPLICPQWWP
jgi:hypothetical protein